MVNIPTSSVSRDHRFGADPHLGSLSLKPRTATRQADCSPSHGMAPPRRGAGAQGMRTSRRVGEWTASHRLVSCVPEAVQGVCDCVCMCTPMCVSVGETPRYRVPSSGESMKLPKKPCARPFNKVTGPFAGGAEERAQTEEEAPPGGKAEIVSHTPNLSYDVHPTHPIDAYTLTCPRCTPTPPPEATPSNPQSAPLVTGRRSVAPATGSGTHHHPRKSPPHAPHKGAHALLHAHVPAAAHGLTPALYVRTPHTLTHPTAPSGLRGSTPVPAPAIKPPEPPLHSGTNRKPSQPTGTSLH